MHREETAAEALPRRKEFCVIDDNADHRYLVSMSLQRAFADEPLKPNISDYARPEQALAEILPDHQTVIVMDHQLGNGTGIDWLPDFLRLGVGPIIIMTSSGDEEIAAEAFRQGASDYQVKHDLIHNTALARRSVVEALRRYCLIDTNRKLSRSLKSANIELVRKNTALSEMAQTAQRFVADVAHEFRTPLTVIKEFASLIDDGLAGEVTPKQSDFLQFINEAASDLSGLVDDFLDSSKLRARNLRIDRRSIDLEASVEQGWRILDSRAGSRQVSIIKKIDPDLPMVFVDAEKVCRSLINLGMNAIKFSPAGGEVEVSITRDSDDMVRISVTDHGPGIDEETAERLFDRFSQSASGAQSTVKGFGLGLSIVSDLVEMNLGTLSLKSKEGEGSTFTFTVPCAEEAAIIRAFIAQIERNHKEAPIAAIALRRLCDPEKTDELLIKIASSCRPLDVILPVPGTDRLLLIGESNEPAQWIERLIERVDDPGCVGPSGSAMPRLLGAWTVDKAEPELIRLVRESQGEVAIR